MGKEYIDRELVYNQLLNFYRAVTSRYGEDDHYARGIAEGMDTIGEAPAADVAPVMRGRWERDADGDCRCNRCPVYANMDGNEYLYRGHIEVDLSHYCPNCGARMDGGTEE